MTEQLVITEKTSQTKDVRTAVGNRYGAVLPAEGHVFDLQEPLRPQYALYGPLAPPG